MITSTIPFGFKYSPEQIRKILRVSRLYAFDTGPTVENSKLFVEKSWPYKGDFKTYPKFTNRALIHCAVTFDDKTLSLSLDTPTGRKNKTLKAPKGYIFTKDEFGIKLARGKADLHLTAKMILDNNISSLRKTLIENENKRKAARSAKKIFESQIKNTVVTLQDSIRAGNCVEGSLRFAELRLKVARNEILAGRHLFHVPAFKVLNGARNEYEKQRAEAAVLKAWERETTICI